MRVLLGTLISVLFFLISCGEPQINPPPALQLIYMPLDKAIDVELDVKVQVYFSDAVDQTSLNKYTMPLDYAKVVTNVDPYQCDSVWTGSEWKPVRNDTKPQLVEFQPEPPGSLLLPDKCYRIKCTTEIKGESTGPLQDLGDIHNADVGAMGIFRTKEEG